MSKTEMAGDLDGVTAGAESTEGKTSADYRLMHRNGSFESRRKSRSRSERVSYLALLTMPWRAFFLLLAGVYLFSNLLFAGLYLLCGPAALAANGPGSNLPAFWRAFFFSIQTLSTIGYGALVPVGIPANLLVAAESIYGVLAYALITGLFFARFSRIRARIRFSRLAVLGAEGEKQFLRIRMTNVSASEVVELSARVLYSYLAGPRDAAIRKFAPLPMEPRSVAFLPLAWTMEHLITEGSPLLGRGRLELEAERAEILVLITGLDQSSGQTIHARTSYTVDEIAFDSTYHDMFERDPSGKVVSIDLDRFDRVDPLASGQDA